MASSAQARAHHLGQRVARELGGLSEALGTDLVATWLLQWE